MCECELNSLNALPYSLHTTTPYCRACMESFKLAEGSDTQMENIINHKLIIDELIKCVKLNGYRKPEDYGIGTDFHIREFHTVGLKTTRQVGLTTYIRTQITKGSKACVITNQPVIYDEDTENVFDVDQQSMDEMCRADTGLTTFFVEQHAVPCGDKLSLYRYLYSIAGEELIIIELYS